MSSEYPDYPDVVLGILIVDCADPERLATFWGALLGREINYREEPYVGLEWAPRFGAGLVFQRTSAPRAGKNRLHPDIICSDVPATAKRVEELGGRRHPDYPEAHFLVMLDPEDNEFCLIPPPGS
jgi:predicted enzyme related to lactoylglutathione lyase